MHGVVALLLFWLQLVNAAPFLTTWQTDTADETINLPPIEPESEVTIDWGDATALTTLPAAIRVNASHTYASPGLHNVSMAGRFFWRASGGTTQKLVITSWGDGFLVDQNSTSMFLKYRNLQVSAPPNTQPVFLAGASLRNMFYYSSFNSPLDWDLTNVTTIEGMFLDTPLNQPITFRNTQQVTSIMGLFNMAIQFNQPFHFDASGLLDASYAFAHAEVFNQVVNLTNSQKLTTTANMFDDARLFNQPINFNTDSVTDMSSMFANALRFNQPVTFNTSQVTTISGMFGGATEFNQPINFPSCAPEYTDYMFYNAQSFNQPVVINTSRVTNMRSMFDLASLFDQDLSSWDTQNVSNCNQFCAWCGLPSFPRCTPCVPIYTNAQNLSVCTSGTRSPTTFSPTPAPSLSPSLSPSTPAPSLSPSTPAPSTRSPSPAPSPAPSGAPSTSSLSSFGSVCSLDDWASSCGRCNHGGDCRDYSWRGGGVA